MWIINKTVNEILNLFLPENCLGCGQKNTYLCPECVNKMPAPPFGKDSRVLAATSYENPTIKKAIHALKYKKAGKIALPLAQLIEVRLHSIFNERGSTCLPVRQASIIIPVPMTKKRLRQRGFNQAEIIARHLSDITSLPLLTNVLYKNKETASQVDRKRREKRLKNLKNCFCVKNPEFIKDKNIFLLDDVFTTGATISECRKVLMKNGARRVTGVVVAC